MKNEKIVNSWNKIGPDEETKQKIFENIMQNRQQKKQIKFKMFKPARLLIAAALILVLTAGVGAYYIVNLFFVPGLGITDDGGIIYYGIEEPFEIETEYGTIKIEYISKVRQGGKIDLNIYMTANGSFPVSWLDPLVISAYNGGEIIFEEKVLDRAVTHDDKAFFFTYKNFPDIDKFDLNLYGNFAEVSLKEMHDEVAFSKENNGVTLAVQKVNGSETMYFTGIYGTDISPDNYRFSGAMTRFSSSAHDKDGNMFELLDQGAERFFGNGFSIGFHKNANEIKSFKCDRLELYYSKLPDLSIFTFGPIDDFPTNHPFDIFELPVPKDGETIEVDITIPVGQYIYKIASISREGDKLYIEDNSSFKLKHDESGAVTWEPMRGTPEYEQAVENQECLIGWVTFISGDLTEDMQWRGWEDRYESVSGGIIKKFDKNAGTIKLALAEIQIYQYGNFDVEFE